MVVRLHPKKSSLTVLQHVVTSPGAKYPQGKATE